MTVYNILMLKHTIIAMMILISTVAQANTGQVEMFKETPYVEVKEKTVDEMIIEIAPMFNQEPSLIKKIIYCESGGEVKSHDGGRGTNITGIHNTTFDYWLKKYEKEYNETLNKESTYDQIKMMSWAFSQGEDYRRQWTSYVAYKNGGEYTFYSSLLKGTYTSRCK